MKKRMNQTSRSRDGFTLMEVLLVLAIVVILSSAAVVTYTGMQKGANINAAKSQVAHFDEAAGFYQFAMGDFPNSLQDLRAMPSDADGSKWTGPYLKTDGPYLDPWGMEYVYLREGGRNADRPTIYSLGPDRSDQTSDDIGNW